MEKERQRKRAQGTRLLAFFAALSAFPEKLLSLLSATVFGRFLLGQDACRAAIEESRIGTRMCESRLRNGALPLRHRIAALLEKSRIGSLFRTLSDIARYTETRTYGVLCVTAGAYSSLVYVIPQYILPEISGSLPTLYVGIALFLVGVLLLLSKKPLLEMAQESPLLSFLLYRVLGLSRAPRARKSRKVITPTAAFLLGSAFGIAGFFIDPLWMVLAVLLTVAFFSMLSSPELSLFSAILFAPFLIFSSHPTVALAVVLLVGLIGYVFKVLLGKRLFSFQPLDLCVLLLASLYLGAVFLTKGGLESRAQALIALILLSGYFLAANLLNTPEKINRAVNLLLFGGTAVAVIGLVQELSGHAIADWLDSSAYDYIAGRITSVFENPNVLAVYLVLLFPLTLSRLLQRGGVGGRIGSALMMVIFLAATVYTWSRGAWIAVILSLSLFIFLMNPSALYALIPMLIAFPIFLHYAPSAIGIRFSSITSLADTSVSYRLGIWQGSLSMVSEHLFSGIGVGTAAFGALYPLYAPAGMEAAPHAHNLLLQLLCEFGIVGPLVFLLLVAFFLQCFLSHRHEETQDDFRLLGLGIGCGVIALLVNGMFDYTFYNSRIFFLFFVLVGIMAAISRVGRTRRARMTPLPDRDNDAFSTDIEIL